jgi:hypothetical protein
MPRYPRTPEADALRARLAPATTALGIAMQRARRERRIADSKARIAADAANGYTRGNDWGAFSRLNARLALTAHVERAA